ncbi:MAG: hypothetical protein WCA81_18415 [Rhizomicrobium sp.]|jgi:hypothetical protein
MSNAPRFESEFLEGLAFAFRKRRKSLSHRASGAECVKVYELVGDERMERLEIYLPKYGKVMLRLHAWPDRKIWLDARQSTKKGWAWAWTREGRLLGSSGAPEAIAALETTFDRLFEMTSSRTNELSEPWATLIANGPKPVR